MLNIKFDLVKQLLGNALLSTTTYSVIANIFNNEFIKSCTVCAFLTLYFVLQTALLLKTQSPVFSELNSSPSGASEQKGKLLPDER